MNPSLEGISLHVTDVEQSIAFYARIPGAVLVQHRPNQFARFKIGEGSLHLVQLPGKNRFHVELDTTDVNGLYEHLRANGMEPASPPQHHPWGKHDFKLVDPDGNWLEFGKYEGNPTI